MKQKRKTFNGKPLSHWKKMADEIVIHYLVKTALSLDHPLSLPGTLAAKKLMEMALSINRGMVRLNLEERDRFQHGLQVFLSAVLPGPTKSAKKRRKK